MHTFSGSEIQGAPRINSRKDSCKAINENQTDFLKKFKNHFKYIKLQEPTNSCQNLLWQIKTDSHSVTKRASEFYKDLLNMPIQLKITLPREDWQ